MSSDNDPHNENKTTMKVGPNRLRGASDQEFVPKPPPLPRSDVTVRVQKEHFVPTLQQKSESDKTSAWKSVQPAEKMGCTLRLGSSAACDITIQDPTIDAEHLTIEQKQAKTFEIVDLQSRYGVFVSGKRITKALVNIDDVLQVGHLPVTVHWLTSHFPLPGGTLEPGTMVMTTKTMIIGREEPADFFIAQPIISKCHLETRLGPDGLLIRDLNSSNGSYVNGQEIGSEWVLVAIDDSIALGNYRISKPMFQRWIERLGNAASPLTTTSSVMSKLPREGDKVVFIGRDPQCDIPIVDPTVSWRHARISIKGGKWTINDLGSSNGTFVDGKKVRRSALLPSSELRIGGVTLQLDNSKKAPIETEEVRLDAHNISRILSNKNKILDDISLSIYPGEMVALMGPSGAGKTTLLELLTGQRQPSEGRILLNGKDLHIHWDEFRHQIGYVPQEDIMHRDLTVFEVLYHNAKLRLPSDLPRQAIIDSVERLMTQMGLVHLRDNLIGGEHKRGISGGQRKRVNIAIELITEPALLFLDEPTSGLDATATLEVLGVLRNLADHGKTIVMTIHQPRVEAYQKIDNLILLARGGKLAYFGPAEAVDYFQTHSHREKDIQVNPADFIVDVVDDSALKSPEQWRDIYARSPLRVRYVTHRLGAEISAEQKLSPSPKRPFFSQFSNLFSRYTKRKNRDHMALIIQLMQAPIIGGILAGLFVGEGAEFVGLEITPQMEKLPMMIKAMQFQNGIHPTLFLLCAAAFWFGCSNVARELTSDMPVFLRESRSGLRVFAYVTSIFIYQLFIAAIQTFILTTVIWLALGMTSSFLVAWGLLLLTAAFGIALGLTISSLSKTEVTAISLVPLLLFPQLLLGGYIKLYGAIEGSFWGYVAQLMPVRWSFEALIYQEYAASRIDNPNLRQLEEIIGFSATSLTFSVFVLLIGTLGCLLMTCAVLQLKRN